MKKLRIELLGNPVISVCRESGVRLRTKKSLALLVYLASPPGASRSREALSALLWSRSAEEQARSSLRQELVRIRKSLGDFSHVVGSVSGQIYLDPEYVSIDTLDFQSLLAQGETESIEKAAELIQGEFAAGLALNEKPFEEWLSNERFRFSQLAVEGLNKLLEQYETEGRLEESGVIAQKLLYLDPFLESAHRSLMRSLASQGRFESALQQFRLCQDILKAELSISPGQATVKVRDEIIRLRESNSHTPMAPRVESDQLVMNGANSEKPGSAGTVELPIQLKGLNLVVPERPSIVILPFRNLTGDRENEYLADGIRIDIQAALVKITGIFLIAAGSANAVRSADSREAARALGVRYALTGSLRRAGDDLRISAEIIDAVSGYAVWTETYDRKLDNGFAVQDEIIEQIVISLDVKLLRGEQAAVWHRTLKDRNALEYFYKGVHEFFKIQKEANLRARNFFEEVDRMQPNVAIGSTWTALCHWFDAFKGWGSDQQSSLSQAEKFARKAVKMTDADGQAHMVLSHVHLMNRNFDQALIVGRQAVALRPNCTNANGFFANVLHYCGEQQDAIEHITWAIRYSPVYPPFFADVLAQSFLFSDRFDEALAVADESLRVNAGGLIAKLVKAAAYSGQENTEKAQEIGREIIESDSAFSIDSFADRQPYRNQDDLNRFLKRLKQAGI